MATGLFSGKFILEIVGSGSDGSIDTGLKFISRPEAEPIKGQTHTHTQNTSIIIKIFEHIFKSWTKKLVMNQRL